MSQSFSHADLERHVAALTRRFGDSPFECPIGGILRARWVSEQHFAEQSHGVRVEGIRFELEEGWLCRSVLALPVCRYFRRYERRPVGNCAGACLFHTGPGDWGCAHSGVREYREQLPGQYNPPTMSNGVALTLKSAYGAAAASAADPG